MAIRVICSSHDIPQALRLGCFVRRVQRLVHVADQVQEKFEREDFFRPGDKRIAQFDDELLDFIDHAVVGGTGAG